MVLILTDISLPDLIGCDAWNDSVPVGNEHMVACFVVTKVNCVDAFFVFVVLHGHVFCTAFISLIPDTSGMLNLVIL